MVFVRHELRAKNNIDNRNDVFEMSHVYHMELTFSTINNTFKKIPLDMFHSLKIDLYQLFHLVLAHQLYI